MQNDPEHYARLVRRAALAATLTATLLIVGKLIAWLGSGSASLLASLTDSLMDVAASLLNLMALRYATQPADDQHRFGHGKMESLAAVAQAMFIAGSSLLLILHGIDRLAHPSPINQVGMAVFVMVLSTIATAALLLYQRYVISKTGSLAIKADSLHYRSDLLMNLAVLLALGLSAWGLGMADAVLAIAIGLYMAWSAKGIAEDAIQHLLDRELPEQEKQQIQSLAEAHPGVHGIHDLRTRQAGGTRFVQMHVELADELPLVDAHQIADDIEAKLKKALGNCDVIIHQDPISVVTASRAKE
ncbi:cation diffusion facilitator family transporter [Corallincola luteus]|uniref:Cation-efflux pump FieF n=2 Tax=Corallincola TaxID=1775176 RepID=A0A368NK23_9GAMM|nr:MULTISPECIES: cation diffusion facilitator family transporter [Corallincola]RCU50957.1 cation diffusion facilitator family transporter [Corallincola holothuriorum]TCI04019.1 cation diffusion facilitator family transporter [Corallincola luteus]